jgi:ribosomal protein S3
MAAKKTTKKKKAAPETLNVPRSAVTLAEAITRRMKRSPAYWDQLQAAMKAGAAGIPWRAAQVEPRQTAH